MAKSSASAEILWDNNDMVVEVRGLEDDVSGEHVNDATVTCTLIDSAGSNVTGQSWPLTLSYVAESDGVYRATIPYSVATVAGADYTLQIDVNAGSGLRGQWSIPCLCKKRT